jgi:hypothetical protein
MQVHCLLLAVLAAVLSACNNDPKPKVEPKQEPQKLGENPIAAPLDYIAAIGKARKATLGRLDQAKLIDAIQKFEASEGRAPKDLSELVPNFITAIPPAPAGMKLEYQPADASFMLVPIAPAPAEKK